MYVGKLRRKLEPLGFILKTHNRIGYLLEKPRKKKVEIVALTDESQAYAAEMECTIRSILSEHVEVGFESQVAIMGVAIGAILHQLPVSDRDHCIKVLVSNIKQAPKFVQTMRMQ